MARNHLRWGIALALLAACGSAGEEDDSDDEASGAESNLNANPNGANDTYPSFKALAAKEKEGVDYAITTEQSPSNVLVLAIHGGLIEAGSSDVARAIARGGTGDEPFDLYLFEGQKPANNFSLHITSRRFDEPKALAMAGAAERCLSIHGFKNPDEAEICVGGRDDALKREVVGALTTFVRDSKSEGVSVRTSGGDCDNFQAVELENIVNRCGQRGVQLEMSSKWRKSLADEKVRAGFAAALRSAVAKVR